MSNTLRNEIETDPNARGYAGMDAQAVADDMNTAYVPIPVTSLSGSELYNAIVPSDFQALTDVQREYARDVLSLGDAIDVSPGTNARDVLVAIFAGTGTLTAMAALTTTNITRGAELGLGTIKPGWVEQARA